MPSFLQNLLALPAKTKAVLGVSAFAILAIAFVMLKIATAPSYALIATGLDPAQTGKITAALDEQGIAYELRNNGTALAVQKSADGAGADRARRARASQATGGGDQPGYELFDESKLGASQFQQQVTYQRALEGEVARTLSSVEGVSNPTVQIVLPQDDLFQDEATPATAAIMLGNPADTLQPGAVRGMAQLAASSVKGLKTENVTITDSTGAVLWPSADGAAGAGGGSSKACRRGALRPPDRELDQLDARRTLGPGKAQVKVNADLNVDETTRKELTYAAKGTPLKTTEETEKLKGGSADRRRRRRHGLQHPDLLGGASARRRQLQLRAHQEGQRLRRQQEGHRDRDRRRARSTSSTSRCWSTSRSRRRSSTRSRQTVATAAGLDTARGDTITATQMAFAKAESPKAGPVPTTLLGPLKWVGLGLAAPALPVLHDARHAQARGREPRHAGLADHDRGAGLAGRSSRPAPPRAPRPRRHADAAPARAGRQPAPARPADGARARARRRPGQGLDGGGLVDEHRARHAPRGRADQDRA